MEKKEYIVPSIQIIDVRAIRMVCASVVIAGGRIISNTGGRGQERRGTWGDLWTEDGEVD